MWQNYLKRSPDKTSQASATLPDGSVLWGYYHWRVAQQGLVHLVPHLQEQPRPKMPDAHPCGKPLPPGPAQSKTQAMGASGKRPDRAQAAPGGSGQESTLSQGGQPSTSGQGGMTTAPRQSGKSSTPCQSGGPASSSGSGTPAASGGPPNCPPGGKELVTGTICTCVRRRVRSLSPQHLHTRSGWQR